MSFKSIIQCVAAAVIFCAAGCQSSSSSSQPTSYTSAGDTCQTGTCAGTTVKASTGGTVCNGTTVRAR